MLRKATTQSAACLCFPIMQPTNPYNPVPSISPTCPTLQFDVKSYSTAFDGGASTKVTYTVPATYKAPAQAPTLAPTNLVVDVYGSEVRVSHDEI